MESKTDIGKAFREKLDQLHKQPGDSVWDSIRGDLDRSKPKGKVIPFWAQLTSIAAMLLLTGIITYPEWQNYVPHIYIEMPGEKNKSTSPETIVAKEVERSADKENTGEGSNNVNEKTSSTQYDELPEGNEDVAGATQSGIRTETKKPVNIVTVKSNQVIDTDNTSKKISPEKVNEIKPVGSGVHNENYEKKPDSNEPDVTPAAIDFETDPIYRNYRNNDASVPRNNNLEDIKPVTKDSIM